MKDYVFPIPSNVAKSTLQNCKIALNK